MQMSLVEIRLLSLWLWTKVKKKGQPQKGFKLRTNTQTPGHQWNENWSRPPNSTHASEAIKQDLFEIQIKQTPANKINLTLEQYDAITSLIIKKVPPQSHSDYIRDGVRQLSDTAFHQKLDQDPLSDHQREIGNTLLEINQKGEISRKSYIIYYHHGPPPQNSISNQKFIKPTSQAISSLVGTTAWWNAYQPS